MIFWRNFKAGRTSIISFLYLFIYITIYIIYCLHEPLLKMYVPFVVGCTMKAYIPFLRYNLKRALFHNIVVTEKIDQATYEIGHFNINQVFGTSYITSKVGKVFLVPKYWLLGGFCSTLIGTKLWTTEVVGCTMIWQSCILIRQCCILIRQ